MDRGRARSIVAGDSRGPSLAELSSLDATALADLVRARSISPLELIEATIRRIEQMNPWLNAIVTPLHDEALSVAAQSVSGPFDGVPFLLKDLFASYGGARLTGGSRFLKDFVAPFDTELVARLKRAGLIIVGKTNTPEFGLLPTTEPELGHEVTEAAPTLDGEQVIESLTTVWAAGTAWTIDSLARATGRTPTPEQFEQFTWHLAELGRRITAPQYLLAVQALQQVGRELARFQHTYHVWLTPTLAEPPLPLGTLSTAADDPWPTLMRASAFVPFTPLCNASGQPAMPVPLFWNDASVPIGAHFIGRFGDEATLFRLAAQLEAARPWANRRPPIPP